MELLIGFHDKAVEVNDLRIADQLLEISDRHRFIEEEALHVLAAQIGKIISLQRLFNTFDDDRNTQGLGHIDDGLDDIDAFLNVVFRNIQKLGIELYDIDRHILQHIQR